MARRDGAAEAGDAPLYRRSNAKSETYGFSLYIFASVLWVLWVLWAVCPDSVLMRLGIAWFPRRDWAYLLIAWSLVLVLMTYIGFGALNMYHTPPLDSLDCMTGTSRISPRRRRGHLPHPGARRAPSPPHDHIRDGLGGLPTL